MLPLFTSAQSLAAADREAARLLGRDLDQVLAALAPVGPGTVTMPDQDLQDDGTLLVPVGACAAAETISTDDPHYALLLSQSVPAAKLRGNPEEDAALAACFARNYEEGQP